MGKSPISRSEAEAKGWVIVHEDDNFLRAEKYLSGNEKIEAAGHSEGLLLEAIYAIEAFNDNLELPAQEEIVQSGVLVDEDGNVVPSVTGPDGQEFTDSEWESRDAPGGSPEAKEAAAAREDASADAENEAKAEPDVGKVETIELLSRDNQLDEVLTVQKGEESMADVIARKQEQGAQLESDRAVRGEGIGPNKPEENPLGGPAEVSDGVVAEEVEATPAAEELAEEKDVDLSQVEGTGKDGKITKSDVASAASEGDPED